jgi:hypothetical protein
MIHAGDVAASPEALDAWINRTDDLRGRLTNGGYGTAFTADDLFPLFQSFVAKAMASTPPRSEGGFAKWLWIGLIVFVAIVVGVIVAARMAL